MNGNEISQKGLKIKMNNFFRGFNRMEILNLRFLERNKLSFAVELFVFISFIKDIKDISIICV